MVAPPTSRSKKNDDWDTARWQESVGERASDKPSEKVGAKVDETTKLRPDPPTEQEPPIHLAAASDENRRGFVRKVYAILSAQLIATAVVAYFLKPYIEKELSFEKALYMALIGCAGVVAVSWVRYCCRSAFQKFPVNYLVVLIFTACESLVVTFLCYQFSWKTIGVAVSSTALIFAVLTLFAAFTRIDFTGYGVYLFGALVTLIIASIVFCAMYWFKIEATWWYMGLMVACLLLFSLYLIYDTQQILGGRDQEMCVDEYCWAVLMLYYDIVRVLAGLLNPNSRS